MVTWIKEESPRANGEIPKISENDLNRLHAKYAPLIRQKGILYRIATPDFRNVAYTWDPKLLEPVEFQEVFRSQAAFPCGYYGMFKPSIAEVLCQIPEQLVITHAANAYHIDMDSVQVYSTGAAQQADVVWGRI